VVDDNRDAATSLAMTLELTFRPDLILLDLDMSRLNGYETASRIREPIRTPRTA
jgi:CheY-like chemotaxis protein